MRHTLQGHIADIYQVVFHPDGHLLTSGSADGTVLFWDLHALDRVPVELSQPAQTHQAERGTRLYTLAFSPDGRILASAGVGPIIRLWDMTQAHRPELFEARKTVLDPSEREILAFAFSADGTKLAGGGTRQIHLWDLASGTLLRILRQRGDWVTAVAFSPEGTTWPVAATTAHLSLGRGGWDSTRRAPRPQ